MASGALHLDHIGGDGPPMLLLHGWAMHSGIFAPVLAGLSRHFDLYLLDLPGHGHSRMHPGACSGEAILADVPARIPRAIWLGWSLGGLLALEAALHAPEQVRAVALCAASPRFTRAEHWPHGVPAQVFQDFAHALEQRFERTIERFLALETLGSQHAHDELKQLKKTVFAHGKPELSALQQGLQALQTRDYSAQLHRLQMPSLWLSGGRDRLVAPQAVAMAAALAPNAHSHCFERAAHAPFMTDPDAFVREVWYWSKQL